MKGTIERAELVASVDELEFLGWSDYQSGLKLIEWPERVPFLKDEADLEITMNYDEPGRVAKFSSLSARGGELLEKIAIFAGSSVTS